MLAETCMWRWENLEKFCSVLRIHHVALRDGTQVIRTSKPFTC